MQERTGVIPGDLVLLVAAEGAEAARIALGAVRLAVGEHLRLRDAERHASSWVTDFPMFEWDDALGLSEETALSRFGFLLEALESGAPLHRGIALRLDPVVMLLCWARAIREVIAFPKTMSAACLMTQSPLRSGDGPDCGFTHGRKAV